MKAPTPQSVIGITDDGTADPSSMPPMMDGDPDTPSSMLRSMTEDGEQPDPSESSEPKGKIDMAIRTETVRAGEFIQSEANGSLSRGQGTLAVTALALAAGTVLGKVTATDEYAPYDAAASDGTESAIAILYAPAAISATTQPVALFERLGEVSRSLLVFADDQDATAQGLAIVDLAEAFIIAR